MVGLRRIPTALTVILIAVLPAARCNRERPAPAAASRPPTFSRDVAPVLYERCAPCHRPGQSAPFSLLQYADVRPRAAAVAKATATRYMPPWLPDPGQPAMVGERVLTPDQIQVIQRWVAGGAAEGSPADLPPSPTWTNGWEL